MANRRKPEPFQQAISDERALGAFTDQLERLQALKHQRLDEAEDVEREWTNLTQSIIEGTFGKESSNISKFHHARWAGEHNITGVSRAVQQSNYEQRIRQMESLLRSMIAELKLRLPDPEIRGVYPAGDPYAFYRDLSGLIIAAKSDILVVDAYVDQTVFDLYVSKVPNTVRIRILSKNVTAGALQVARLYAASNALQIRTDDTIHDRHIFIDQRGWIVGQSLKDAAQKKPTYLVELSDPTLTVVRGGYEEIWNSAKVIV